MKSAVVCPNRNDLFVPSIGTVIWIRHNRWLMQICCTRGGRGFSKPRDFEPGRPPDIAWRPFQFSHTTSWRNLGVPRADLSPRPHCSPKRAVHFCSTAANVWINKWSLKRERSCVPRGADRNASDVFPPWCRHRAGRKAGERRPMNYYQLAQTVVAVGCGLTFALVGWWDIVGSIWSTLE
jgi:hypothetical protein